MKLELEREWYESHVANDDDHEVGAGTYSRMNYQKIGELAQRNLNSKGIFGMLSYATEELGELATALNVEAGMKFKDLDENSKGEAADLTICALAIFFAKGGNVGELHNIIEKKLDKWEKNMERQDLNGLMDKIL